MATVVPIERLRVLPMEVLADVALGKLRRLLQLRHDRQIKLNPSAEQLVDRCIVASLEDAMDAGAYVRARAVIRETERKHRTGGMWSGWGRR